MMKIRLTALLFFAGLLPAGAQDFYDVNTIQEIRLTFSQSNWDHLLDSLKDVDGDFLTAQAEINGQPLFNVGVAYKGNNSYDPDNAKNPIQIELDHQIPNQQYAGVEEIRLGNGFGDPSLVREVLSTEILGRYAVAPRANFARVWINGEYWGLYTNLETVGKRFVRSRFYTDGENPFFKCNPEDFDGPGTGGNYPDLVLASPDSAFYYDKYKLESDYGWRELLALMDTLQNHPGSAPAVLDVDRALWMLAFNNVLVNLDSYTGAYAQNYYLYRDENARWLPVVWDLDLSLGAFPLLAPPGGTGGPPLTLAQMQQLDPLAQAANAARPLISQLLADPVWRRMYVAHLRTIVEEFLANDACTDRAAELQALISVAVLTDTKKFFNYAEFQANLYESIEGGLAGDVPGLTELLDARRSYLAAHPVLAAPAPAITSAEAQVQNGAAVHVSAFVAGADAVWAGWRFDSAAVFQKTPLFDDGQHDDDAANDGVYGGSFPIGGTQAQYFIYAENAQAGQFSPARAEHEFYLLAIALPTASAGQVVINEFLADNETGATDETGQREDWLELFNTTGQALSLAGLYLSDKVSEPDKWAFPAGAFIPAGGYRIVWLDEQPQQGLYHAGLKLSADGEALLLSNGSMPAFDQVIFGAQQPDVSYGRYPNGTGPFVPMPTTFNGPNSLVSSIDDWFSGTFKIYPNPVNSTLHVEAGRPTGDIHLFNAFGQLVFFQKNGDSPAVDLNFAHLPPGLYGLRIGGHFVRKIVVQR